MLLADARWLLELGGRAHRSCESDSTCEGQRYLRVRTRPVAPHSHPDRSRASRRIRLVNAVRGFPDPPRNREIVTYTIE